MASDNQPKININQTHLEHGLIVNCGIRNAIISYKIYSDIVLKALSNYHFFLLTDYKGHYTNSVHYYYYYYYYLI